MLPTQEPIEPPRRFSERSIDFSLERAFSSEGIVPISLGK